MSLISLNSGFLRSAARGDLESLEKYLKEGADILAKDVDGAIGHEIHINTPAGKNALHLAVAMGQEKVVEYLTQQPSALIVAKLVNGTDDDRNPPVADINYTKKVPEKIFKFLLSAGTLFDHVNKYKVTCIHYLAQNPKNASFLKLALDNAAGIETIAKTLNSIPIDLIRLIGSYDGRKEKVLNCQTELPPYRLTPLHHAISCKNKKAVELLKDGTDLSLKITPTSKTLKEELEDFERTFRKEVLK
jgi:ankyrin repeat protein